MSEIDLLTKEAMRIYTMFCMPHILYSFDTGKVEIEYIWTNVDAEKTYNLLLERIECNFLELRKREAAQHHVYLTGGTVRDL